MVSWNSNCLNPTVLQLNKNSQEYILLLLYNGNDPGHEGGQMSYGVGLQAVTYLCHTQQGTRRDRKVVFSQREDPHW